MMRVYDGRTNETLFVGSVFKCADWINNYIEKHEDEDDYIWMENYRIPPSEEDVKEIEEVKETYGLAYAIESGILKSTDVSHEQLADLIHDVIDSLNRINRIMKS